MIVVVFHFNIIYCHLSEYLILIPFLLKHVIFIPFLGYFSNWIEKLFARHVEQHSSLLERVPTDVVDAALFDDSPKRRPG